MPRGTPTLRAGTYFEALEQLPANLAQLEGHTLVSPLPVAEPDDAVNRLVGLRVQAVRARLKLLQYEFSEVDKSPEVLDPALEAAVREFQREAGITVDGWVGPETWGALQQLVSFETPMQVEHWFVPESSEALEAPEMPRPALTRAVLVRLSVLGFYEEDSVSTDPTEAIEPLKHFADFSEWSGFRRVPRGWSPQTIAALFAHDELLAFLSCVPEGRFLLPFSASRGEPQLVEEQVIIARLVRAELWLRGFDVKPLRTPIQPDELIEPLRALWLGVDPELGEHDLARQSRVIDAALLQALHVEPEELQLNPEEVVAYVEKNVGVIEQAWDTLRGAGQFLWDGFKRSVQWIWTMLRRSADWARNSATVVAEMAAVAFWNAARFLYDQAAEALLVVRRGIAAFTSGIADLFGTMSTGDRTLHLHRSPDLDTVVVAEAPSAGAMNELVVRTRRSTLAFELGCKVLSIITSIVFSAAAAGWSTVLLLIRLVEHARELAALGRELLALDQAAEA